METDKVKEWIQFSEYMVGYLETPKEKYGETSNKFDLMPFTSVAICIWCILKYALRLHLGHGKQHDLEKIAHYAQMAWYKNAYKDGHS